MDKHNFSNSINRQLLYITADSEETALILQPRLSDINKKRLIPIIESIMNEFSSNDELITIDRIDIHLHRIPLANLDDTQLDHALAQGLRDQLRPHIKPRKNKPLINDSNSKTIDALNTNINLDKPYHLDVVSTYLHSGVLPTWLTHQTSFSFQTYFKRILKDQPNEIASIIRQGIANKSFRFRLAHQIDSQDIAAIIALLLGDDLCNTYTACLNLLSNTLQTTNDSMRRDFQSAFSQLTFEAIHLGHNDIITQAHYLDVILTKLPKKYHSSLYNLSDNIDDNSPSIHKVIASHIHNNLKLDSGIPSLPDFTPSEINTSAIKIANGIDTIVINDGHWALRYLTEDNTSTSSAPTIDQKWLSHDFYRLISTQPSQVLNCIRATNQKQANEIDYKLRFINAIESTINIYHRDYRQTIFALYAFIRIDFDSSEDLDNQSTEMKKTPWYRLFLEALLCESKNSTVVVQFIIQKIAYMHKQPLLHWLSGLIERGMKNHSLPRAQKILVAQEISNAFPRINHIFSPDKTTNDKRKNIKGNTIKKDKINESYFDSFYFTDTKDTIDKKDTTDTKDTVDKKDTTDTKDTVDTKSTTGIVSTFEWSDIEHFLLWQRIAREPLPYYLLRSVLQQTMQTLVKENRHAVIDSITKLLNIHKTNQQQITKNLILLATDSNILERLLKNNATALSTAVNQMHLMDKNRTTVTADALTFYFQHKYYRHSYFQQNLTNHLLFLYKIPTTLFLLTLTKSQNSTIESEILIGINNKETAMIIVMETLLTSHNRHTYSPYRMKAFYNCYTYLLKNYRTSLIQTLRWSNKRTEKRLLNGIVLFDCIRIAINELYSNDAKSLIETVSLIEKIASRRRLTKTIEQWPWLALESVLLMKGNALATSRFFLANIASVYRIDVSTIIDEMKKLNTVLDDAFFLQLSVLPSPKARTSSNDKAEIDFDNNSTQRKEDNKQSVDHKSSKNISSQTKEEHDAIPVSTEVILLLNTIIDTSLRDIGFTLIMLCHRLYPSVSKLFLHDIRSSLRNTRPSDRYQLAHIIINTLALHLEESLVTLKSTLTNTMHNSLDSSERTIALWIEDEPIVFSSANESISLGRSQYENIVDSLSTVKLPISTLSISNTFKENSLGIALAYEYLEYLDYFLDNRCLPISCFLERPAISLSHILDKTQGFSTTLVKSTLLQDSPERLIRLQVLASVMSDKQQDHFLSRIIPDIGKRNSPMDASYRHFLAITDRPTLYFAKLVDAALSEKTIDFEVFSDKDTHAAKLDSRPNINTSTHATLLAYHSNDSLQSIIIACLSAGKKVKSAALLMSLAQKDPTVATVFLFNLATNHQTLLHTLLTRLTSYQLNRLLNLIVNDTIFKTINAFIDAVSHFSREIIQIQDNDNLNKRKHIFIHLLFAILKNENKQFIQIEKLFSESLKMIFSDQTIEKNEAQLRLYLRKNLSIEIINKILRETYLFNKNPEEETDKKSFITNKSIDNNRQLYYATEDEKKVFQLLSPQTLPFDTHSPTKKTDILSTPKESPEKLKTNNRSTSIESKSTNKITNGQIQLLSELLMGTSPEIKKAIVKELSNINTTTQWIENFPESILIKIIKRVREKKHPMIIRTTEIFYSAWSEISLRYLPGKNSRKFIWLFFFDYLSKVEESRQSMENLLFHFFSFIDENIQKNSLQDISLESVKDKLLVAMLTIVSKNGETNISGLIHRNRHRLLNNSGILSETETTSSIKSTVPAKKMADKTHHMQFSNKSEGIDGDPIYIDNAGLVLLSPFFPQLFQKMDCLHTNGKGKVHIKGPETLSQMVHTLQYLVDGSCSNFEHTLTLNKLLCGVDIPTPVSSEITMSDSDVQSCKGLLTAILSHWPALSGTSESGLQETFLQRKGKLQKCADGWKLTVDRKTVDILIDQAPWSFSLVQHRWMAEPIHVTW